MKFWPSSTPRSDSKVVRTGPGQLAHTSPYIAEYIAAIDRTEKFGFEAPPRVLVSKDCVNMQLVLPVLLDYYDRHSPE